MPNLIDYRDQENKFNEFVYEQMYFGPGTPVTQYAFVRPNVGDKVTRWGNAIYRVTAVDSDGIPTLELQTRLNPEPNINQSSTSLLTAVSMYQPSSSARAFYDGNVTPAQINIDGRLDVRESTSTFIRLFRGTDVSPTGTIISALYRSDGSFDTNDIPLVELTPGDPTIKRPAPFNCTQAIDHGELVAMVSYDASSRVTGIWYLRVVHSAAVMGSAINAATLVDIELVSTLLSTTDNRLINNYVNTGFDTNLVQCRLIYSDGSSTVINVDGTKCILHGVDDFNTTLLGEPKSVLLTYYPDPLTEPFINAVSGNRPFLSKAYKLANITHDTSINLKLYCVPTFVNTSAGYTFKWYLVSLEGDVYMDVTSDVTANVASGTPLSGVDYGTKQATTISVAMNAIGLGGIYANHIHTQTLDITLTVPGTPLASPWLMDYVNGGITIYGPDVKASASNATVGFINISSGETDFNVWLEKIYRRIAPLFDITVQSAATTPTHFQLEYSGVTSEHPITDWENNLPKVTGAPSFVEGQTVLIKWINRVGGTDRVLGVSPVICNLDL